MPMSTAHEALGAAPGAVAPFGWTRTVPLRSGRAGRQDERQGRERAQHDLEAACAVVTHPASSVDVPILARRRARRSSNA